MPVKNMTVAVVQMKILSKAGRIGDGFRSGLVLQLFFFGGSEFFRHEFLSGEVDFLPVNPYREIRVRVIGVGIHHGSSVHEHIGAHNDSDSEDDE